MGHQMRLWRSLLLLLQLGLVPVIGSALSVSPSEAPPSDSARAQVRLQAAVERLQNNDTAGAYRLLKPLTSDVGLDELDGVQQHLAFELAGLCANDLGEYVSALEYLRRSTGMPEATGNEWHARLNAAYRLGDWVDAALSLKTIATRWPESLVDVRAEAIFEVLRQLTIAENWPAWTDTADALFNAGWKISGQEPSQIWATLFERHVEAGRVERAAVVVTAVDRPYELAALKVDHRFQAMVAKMPARFDVTKAAAERVTRLEAAALRAPDHLEPLVDLTYALLTVQQYARVLELTDRVLAEASVPVGDPNPYSDQDEFLIWIMDNRARALKGLGNFAEAAEQLERAARRPEGGRVNTSNAINLGTLYCSMGRSAEALRAIEDVRDLSPYGRMQLERVRFCAARASGDVKSAESALTYIRTHRKDSEGTHLDVLVTAELMDEAADVLIARLKSVDDRSSALLEVQDWNVPVETDWARSKRQRWERLLQREDVGSAIRQAGRREKFDLAPPL